MKKLLLLGLLTACLSSLGFAGTEETERQPFQSSRIANPPQDDIKGIQPSKQDMFMATNPNLKIAPVLQSSGNDVSYENEIPKESEEELNWRRMQDIYTDGVVSEDEKDDLVRILTSREAPYFPPTVDNIVFESEPNDSCHLANIIAVGDTVQCGYVDSLSDPVDYYTFTLDTTYPEWDVTIESHDGMDCGPQLFDQLWLYNADCSVELVYDDQSGYNGHAKIRTTLTPGTYVVRLEPDSWWGNGYYHLSLLAEEYTLIPGQECASAIPIALPADLPYTELGVSVAGMWNSYDDETCHLDSYGYRDGGEDLVYEITVTQDGWYDFNFYNNHAWADMGGVSIGTDCPTTECIIFSRLRLGQTTLHVPLEASVGTYYMILDGMFPTWGLEVDFSIVESVEPLEGETCLNPIQIADPSNYTDTRFLESYENNHVYLGKDVVYTFTLTESAQLEMTLCNSPDDWTSFLWLFEEDMSPCGWGYGLDFEGDWCATGNHKYLIYDCTPGTYYLIVDSGTSWPPLNYTLEISGYIPQCNDPSYVPYNDSCQNIAPTDLYMDQTLTFTGNNCNSTMDCPSIPPEYGPGVWESFTTYDTGNVTIDFCDTREGWGSVYTFLTDGCPCNNFWYQGNMTWENCASGNAQMTFMRVPPGTYYYCVQQNPLYFAEGDYTINVSLDPIIRLDCPPGAVAEGEPQCHDGYYDNFNGGCFIEPPAFSTINANEPICGKTGTFDEFNGDSDWYYYESGWEHLEWVVVSEMPMAAGMYDAWLGCPSYTIDFDWADPLDTIYMSFDAMPGPYHFSANTFYWFGWPCETDVSYIAELRSTPINPYYCDPCLSPDATSYIQWVTFNTISNYTGPEGGDCGYGDYTALSTDVEQYGTYTLTVHVQSNPYWEEVRAWIDWNQDFLFDENESYYLGGNIDPVVSFDITVPADAVLGQTRMRIIEAYDNDPGVWGYCPSGGSGEVEDYTVNVVAGIPPVFSVSPTEVNGAADVGYTDTEVLTVSNTGSGADLYVVSDVWINPPTPALTSNPEETRSGGILMTDADKKETTRRVKDTSTPSFVLQGGDDIATATPITSIPSTLSGTTVGYNDDYYEVCPFTGEGGFDVVYSYVPAVEEWVMFNLCIGNTTFDTRLYIYEDAHTPGDPYSCNEDWCDSPVFPDPYISQLTAHLYPGHTYYIVIDGYDNFAYGSYVLNVFPGVPQPDPIGCPDDGLVASQRPHENYEDGNFHTSDSESGWKSYESYAGAYGEITDITWWGIDLTWTGQGFSECESNSEEFEITFYDDDNGMPGPPIQSYTIPVTPINTGHTYWQMYDQKEYYAELNPPIYAPEGWISIQAVNSTDNCWVMWQTSTIGDNYSLQYDEFGSDWIVNSRDLTFCFNGTAYNWLTVDPEIALIPSGGTGEFTVTMDASALNGGTYTGRIDFETNDPSNPNPEVPVTFVVTGSACDYVVGDVNNSSSFNGLDVTYGVGYFKGGSAPLYECECTPGDIWYVSGDVNSSCTYNGLDITYAVAYFKGGAAPIACGDCPPAGIISATKNDLTKETPSIISIEKSLPKSEDTK